MRNLKIIIFVFLMVPNISFAGEGVLDIKTPEKGSGVYVVNVSVDTFGKEYNAVEGEFKYDQNYLNVENIVNAKSIVSAWLIEPKLSKDLNGYIRFSGIIRNGYSGKNGSLFSVYFTAKNTYEDVEVSVYGKAYLNDGTGTKDEIKITKESFPVVKLAKEEALTKISEDNNPPIILQSAISQNEAMFDGKPFLIVHAKDNESSVSSYEFALVDKKYEENDLKSDTNVLWQSFISPVKLPLDFSEKYLYVRVKDNKNNENYILISFPRELSPQNWKDTLKEWWGFGIIILLVFGLIFLVFRLRRHALSNTSIYS